MSRKITIKVRKELKFFFQLVICPNPLRKGSIKKVTKKLLHSFFTDFARELNSARQNKGTYTLDMSLFLNNKLDFKVVESLD